MKKLVITAFLFCAVAISFGQARLAPNPACPQNAPYCRGQVAGNMMVLGAGNGILYGWQGSGNNASCADRTSPTTLNFYASSTFNQETWVLQGQFPTSRCTDFPIGLVFGPGACSGWKYIYTHNQRILRASSEGWSFTDIAPGVPLDTSGRPASFAAVNQGSRTRLFYGNYNDESLKSGAFIWHSDDCGNTWSAPDRLGQDSVEVHAINADPADGSIYVTVDTEGVAYPNDALGLWRSTSGGDTGSFTRLSSELLNSNHTGVVGINFVFSHYSNKIFFETDNNGAISSGGPLLAWDKINGGDTQIADSWPVVSSGIEAWTGSGMAIGLTSEQNIFTATINEGSNTRNGIWYFEPPNYDMPILLEDVSARIDHVTIDSTRTATAVTIGPHGIVADDPTRGQIGDQILVEGLPGFSPVVNGSPVPVVYTITGPNTFTYPCSSCSPNQTSTSGTGYLTKNNINWFARTVEITDPQTNITYLYAGNQRIVKPKTVKMFSAILEIINGIILDQ